MREAIRMLTGGCLVYIVMAACSGAEPGQQTARTTGAGGSASIGEHGGGTAIDAAVALGLAMDAMTTPVKEAAAQAVPPQVDDIPCNKSFIYPPGTTFRYLYAEKSYPGRTVTDLARIIVVGKMAAAVLPVAPPGTDWWVTLAQIGDGRVAVGCGIETSPNYSSIRFILPTL